MGGYGAVPLDEAPGYGARPLSQSDEEAPGALAQIGTSIKSQAKGLSDLLLAPVSPDTRKRIASGIIEAHKQQYEKAKAAYDSGDYAGMIEHTLGTVVPLVGPLIENTAQKATEGGKPYEAATDLLLGPLISKGLEFAPGAVSGAAGAESPLTRAAQAAKAGIRTAAPEVAAGTAKVGAGMLADQMGVPGHIGALFGAREGAPQIARGIGKGYRAAREAFRGEAAAAGTEGAAAESAMLDDLAQGLAGKKFAKLSDSQQQTIRDIAGRIQQQPEAGIDAASPVDTSGVRVNPPAAPAPAPAVSAQPAPVPAAPAIAPGVSPLAANPVNARALPALDSQPVTPELTPSTRARMDAFMRDLSPEMRLEAAKANYRAMKEGAPHADPNAAYDAAHAANAGDRAAQQTKQARALAHYLNSPMGPEGESLDPIAHEDLARLPLSQQQSYFGQLAKALGLNKTGQMSARSVAETMFELRKLQTEPDIQLTQTRAPANQGQGEIMSESQYSQPDFSGAARIPRGEDYHGRIADFIAQQIPGARVIRSASTDSAYVKLPPRQVPGSSEPTFGEIRVSNHTKYGSLLPTHIRPKAYSQLPGLIDRAVRAAYTGARRYQDIKSWADLADAVEAPEIPKPQ